MKRAATCALLAMALAVSNTAAAATNYSFDYTLTGASALGIDRAFDDGKNTVLRFINTISDHDRPTVTGADGTVLQTRVIGPYLVLPGVQRHVLVYSKGIVAQVQQGTPPPRYPSPYDFAAQAAPAPIAPVPVAPAPAPAPAAQVGPHRMAPIVVTSSVGGIPTGSSVAIGTAEVSGVTATGAASAAGGFAIVTDEPPPQPVWEAKAGSTLRTTTEAWAKQAGWSVRWLLANGDDYEIEGSTHVGEFTDSIAKLYAPYFAPSFNDSKPLHVKAYAKQKIIVVSE